MSAPPPPPPKGKGKSGMSGATDALRALAGLQTTQEQQTAVEAAQKARTLKRRAEDALPDFGAKEHGLTSVLLLFWRQPDHSIPLCDDGLLGADWSDLLPVFSRCHSPDNGDRQGYPRLHKRLPQL